MLDVSWMVNGTCVGTDPRAFYPRSGRHSYKEAKRACGACPVRTECLDYALSEMGEFGIGQHGMWGGSTPDERRMYLAHAA
jgi:WhiB family redox-sensing transcriptional regulator